MSQNPQPIKYGSIIHLENGAVDGGYLGSSRSLIEEDVLNWQDTAVLSFIFTHLFENRVGSSSWEVIPDPSANARPHFYIVNGLDGGETDPSLVSIRLDEPDGAYLFCDVNGAVTTLKDVTTDDQKRRATFKLVDGLAGEGKSFESVVFEHHFLRHTSLKLILTSKIGGDGIFQADATFFVGKTNSKDLIKSYNFPLHSIVSSSQNNAVVIENLSEPRKIDDELRYGDRIRLRNMHSVRSYLDIFDWVQQLKGPFEDYEAEMHNGVFTVDITIRPDHSEQKVFGEWLIQSADKPRKSGVVNEGDKIHLKSTYLLDKGHRHTTFYKPYSPPAESSFLVAHKEVTGNKQLQQGAYNGEKKFVFVGPKGGNNTQLEKGSKEWAITLSNSSQNFYYLWGEVDGKSVDYGSFELGEIVSKSLVRLILSADANKAAGNNKLVGKVSYAGEGILGLEATQKDGNIYSVEHTLNNSQLRDQILPLYPNGDWVFGARKDKKLIAIDIKSADGGQTFSGTFQYEGEEPVSVKGVQPSNKAFEKDGSPMFFNFFDPNDWLERIQKIGDRLAAPKTDIDQAVQAIALAKSATGQTAGLDTVSQTNQLENLRAFWGMMDEFWKAFDAVAQVEIPALHAQDILPPVNTITKCVRHTTIDFEIMQRAIQQRESAGDNNLAQARSLLITDKLADMSLAPFQFLFGDTNTTVTPITFFGKDVYIRQVPYSNQVMFIGLTYDLVASINDSNMPPFELLAIPHEMGHFLYHYENKTIFPAANQNSATHSHQVPAHNSGRFKHRPPTPHTIGW
ncbi:MAG: AbfB domain-containing protein, partial [Chloroflexota bacterium]